MSAIRSCIIWKRRTCAKTTARRIDEGARVDKFSILPRRIARRTSRQDIQSDVPRIERISDTQNRGEPHDQSALGGAERFQIRRMELRGLLAMPASRLRDDVDFVSVEAEQLRILNQVVRMAIVPVMINRV